MASNEPCKRFIRCPAPEAGDLYNKGHATCENDIITKFRCVLAVSAQSIREDLVFLFPRGKRNSCASFDFKYVVRSNNNSQNVDDFKSETAGGSFSPGEKNHEIICKSNAFSFYSRSY